MKHRLRVYATLVPGQRIYLWRKLFKPKPFWRRAAEFLDALFST